METDREEPLNTEELEVEEFEVEVGEDLESAMREALEAVEASAQRTAESAHDGEREGDEEAAEVAGATAGEDSGFDELTTLRSEVAELRDRSVRTLADFDNFRKRVERERLDRERYAGTEILRDTLDVVDNLERAHDSSGEFEDLKIGVELILRQVHDLLRRHGVERVAAVGEAFDPLVHEAVSRQEDETVSVPMVDEELQSGYLIKDRLLRPAMVTVVVPSAQDAMTEEID